MSPKEKKQLMIAIPILVIALFLLLWQMGVIGGGGGEAPTEPTPGVAQPPGAAPGEAPMPGAAPMPAGEGHGMVTAPGTTTGTEGAAAQPTAAPAEEGPPLFRSRPDPFTPFRKTTIVRPPVPLTGLAVERLAQVPPVMLRKRVIPPTGGGRITVQIPGLRVAGVLYNGRAYAIYESGGIAQVVRPGDPVPGGKILAIAPDRVVLLTDYGERQEIKLRAADTGTLTTAPGGYPTPGEPIMPMGPAGPPMPGGGPMGMPMG